MDAAKSLISMHLCDVLEQARLGKVRRQAPATKKQQSQVKQKMTDHWSLITDHWSFYTTCKTKLLTCFISLITDNKTFLLSLLNNTIQQRTWHDSCGSWKPKPTPDPKLHRPAWEAHDPWGISACLPRSRRRTKSKPGDSMIWRGSARSLEESGAETTGSTHLNFLFATMCQSWIYLLHCPLEAELKHTCSATSAHDPDPLRKPPPPARSFLITKLGLQGK